MITDDQVEAAITAAQDEFDRWEFSDMGYAGGRAVRGPPKVVADYSVAPDAAEVAFEMFPLQGDAKQARSLFNFMRARAGMRKALETLKC